MRFDSITDIEEYIRDIIGIPYVNLEGMDIEVCNELVKTLEEAFSLYPLLKKAICTIGHTQYIEEQMNLIVNSEISSDLKDNDWVDYSSFLDDNAMSTITGKEFNNKDIIYSGLHLNKEFGKQRLSELNTKLLIDSITSYHPAHCYSFKSLVFHEIGHVFDDILGISKREEFLRIIQTINVEKHISKYATKSEREAFAEAFAEYHMADQPNEAVQKIVEIGLEEYRKRAEKKSEIFDVSRKFR